MRMMMSEKHAPTTTWLAWTIVHWQIRIGKVFLWMRTPPIILIRGPLRGAALSFYQYYNKVTGRTSAHIRITTVCKVWLLGGVVPGLVPPGSAWFLSVSFSFWFLHETSFSHQDSLCRIAHGSANESLVLGWLLPGSAWLLQYFFSF